jgi:toluene monooxygenase system ferredoxin subunit
VTYVRALAIDDLWEGEMRGCEIAGTPVLLVNASGEVHAFVDRCAHQGVRLSEGRFEAGVLTCAAHGWQYDARTGRGINPASACLRVLDVRIEAGAIFVDAGGAEARR